MELTNFIENDVLFILADRRIDSTNASEFQENTFGIIKDNKKLAIDFVNVNYISSAGLRSVLVIAKEMSKNGGELILFSMSESIKDIFDMAGFSTIIKILKSKDEVFQS